jgi:hypothetical protein
MMKANRQIFTHGFHRLRNHRFGNVDGIGKRRGTCIPSNPEGPMR